MELSQLNPLNACRLILRELPPREMIFLAAATMPLA
jgi:hypothetical protein